MAKKKKYILGIDLGGTKVLTVLFDLNFRVCAEKKSRVEANKGEKVLLQDLEDGVFSLMDECGVSRKNLLAVGVGCPGMIQFPDGYVKLSPNISFLKNYPLGKRLRKSFKVPVVVENDVNAGLYGEQQFGAAVGYRHVVGIFPGTGVGGALILDGKLYRGAGGAAGEIGHICMSLPSFLSPVSRVDTLESLIGRLRIASEAGWLILKQRSKSLYREVEYDIRKIKSKAIQRAVKRGDASLRELIEDKGRILGIAMANAVNLLNPELIVLGGGLIEAVGNLIVPVARKTMVRYALPPVVKSVRVLPAKLGDYAIAMGAAKMAYDYLNRDGKEK